MKTIIGILAFCFIGSIASASAQMTPITGGSGQGGYAAPQSQHGDMPYWNAPHSHPTPQPSGRSRCAISSDSPVDPGEYATLSIQTNLRDIGRLTLTGPDGPVSGVVRNGTNFQYLWRVPDTAHGQYTFSFEILSPNTGFANQTNRLCSGSTVVSVNEKLAVQLHGSNKVPVNQSWLIGATAKGGKAPYRFVWYVDGAGVASEQADSESFLQRTLREKGPHRIRVGVTDSEGRTKAANLEILVYSCSVSVSGTTELEEKKAGRWKVGTQGGYAPVEYRWWLQELGSSGWRSMSLDTFSILVPSFAGKPDATVLLVDIKDKMGCKATATLNVRLVKASQGSATSSRRCPLDNAPCASGICLHGHCVTRRQ